MVNRMPAVRGCCHRVAPSLTASGTACQIDEPVDHAAGCASTITLTVNGDSDSEDIRIKKKRCPPAGHGSADRRPGRFFAENARRKPH